MESSIKPFPDISKYPKLIEAAQRGSLIPFIGAGVSRIAGCPNWEDFANKTLEFIIKRKCFSYAELAQVKHLNPRIKLSIAKSIAIENKCNIDFSEILTPPKKGYDNTDGKRIYTGLSKLSKTFVTTNYDSWLDTIPASSLSIPAQENSEDSAAGIKRKVFYKTQDFTASNLATEDTVIHLHGSVESPDHMIMTTQDYINLYANDRKKEEENPALSFLTHLFQSDLYTVVFIGYGLEELEILEYIMQKAKSNESKKPKVINHFILQGFFSHEDKLFEGLERYYRGECGIQLIPFSLDQKSWSQIIDVVEHLAKNLPAKKPLNIEQQLKMDKLLDDEA